jgi:hypothetical protein
MTTESARHDFQSQKSPSPHVDIFCSAQDEESSVSDFDRLQLRAAVAQVSCEHGAWTSDLAVRPLLQTAAVSISHCPGRMGFAFSRNFQSLGFDVERISRLKRPTIERVSLKEEIKDAPQVEGLWVAKEATFKALSNYDSRFSDLTLSQIKIQSWSETCMIDGLENVRGFKSLVLSSTVGLTFNGYCWSDAEYLYGLCFGPPRNNI